MKILFFGNTSLVGWELQRSLASLGDLVALGSNAAANPDGLRGNCTNLPGLAETVRRVAPDVIVNGVAGAQVLRLAPHTMQRCKLSLPSMPCHV